MYRLLFFILLVLTSLLTSCSINRVVKGSREGRWIYSSIEERPCRHYVSKKGYYYKGRYRKGNEIGTWKYYMDGRLVRKEKYNQNEAWVCYYHPNGKIQREGKTFLEITPQFAHWYYTGLWKYYNENGELVTSRYFDKGQIIEEIRSDELK